MPISPKDLVKVQFRRVLFGWDPEEVTGFLELVRDELLELLKEKENLSEEVEEYKKKIATLLEEEEALKSALVFAQKVYEEMKKKAEQEARFLLEEAELKGQKIVREEMEKAIEERKKVEELRTIRKQLLSEIRHLCERILALIESFEEEDSETILLPPQEKKDRKKTP